MNEKQAQERNTDNTCLYHACQNGDIETVKQLLPLTTNMTVKNEALSWAAERGHIEIVKLLIPVCEPKDKRCYALLWAARSEHIECVKILLPVSDPKTNDSQALRWAARSNNTDLINLLIPVSDYQLVLDKFCTYYDYGLLKQCVDDYETLQQKERLEQELNSGELNNHIFVKRKI